MIRHVATFPLVLSLLVPGIFLTACGPDEPVGEKGPAVRIPVQRREDLPRHTYALSRSALDLVRSDKAVRDLGERVRKDLEADLRTHAITDEKALERIYDVLLILDLLEGRDAEARAGIERLRALQDEDGARLAAGFLVEAFLEAREGARERGFEDHEFEGFGASFRKLFRERLTALVSAYPWAKVQDMILATRGQTEIYSENLLLGLVQARYDDVSATDAEISEDQAAELLRIAFTLKLILPLKADLMEVLDEIITQNRVDQEDIWADRSAPPLDPDRAKPVIVAVWDTGTDTSVFPDRLLVRASETVNGRDDDGNGFVDDVHGIAFDAEARRTPELLAPLSEAAPRYDEAVLHVKGFMDLRSVVESSEARALKRHLAGLNPAAIKGFLDDLNIAVTHLHGTHVAGLILEDNPFVRLLVARIPFDPRMTPVPRTYEWAKRYAAMIRDTVAYFEDSGVRVVNISWSESRREAEVSLERNGIGEHRKERFALSRKVFALQREVVKKTLGDAKGILFVCAAGDSDQDVTFDELLPACLDLPNLIVVGAVDRAGNPSPMTPGGRGVEVYANGYDVESVIPGGDRLRLTGSSMAAPAVTNLAARLIARDPGMTPEAVKSLILNRAETKRVGKQTLSLLHPAKTME